MFASNSSTLILLSKISCLRKFLEIGKVTIPKIVFDELIVKSDSFDTKLIQKEIEEGNVILTEVNENKYKRILEEFKLDKGEAAAFALFNKTEHKAILTDDGELIKLCKIQRVPFICAMAIVVSLFNKKALSKSETEDKLDKLLTIGRYSNEIYSYFKEKVI